MKTVLQASISGMRRGQLVSHFILSAHVERPAGEFHTSLVHALQLQCGGVVEGAGAGAGASILPVHWQRSYPWSPAHGQCG